MQLTLSVSLSRLILQTDFSSPTDLKRIETSFWFMCREDGRSSRSDDEPPVSDQAGNEDLARVPLFRALSGFRAVAPRKGRCFEYCHGRRPRFQFEWTISYWFRIKLGKDRCNRETFGKAVYVAARGAGGRGAVLLNCTRDRCMWCVYDRAASIDSRGSVVLFPRSFYLRRYMCWLFATAAFLVIRSRTVPWCVVQSMLLI